MGSPQHRSRLVPVLLPALLVALLLAVAAAPAMAEGYRLVGNLRIESQNLRLDTADDTYLRAFLKEGGELRLTGPIWNHRFMRASIRTEAFGLHELGDGPNTHGRLLGIETSLTALPASTIPLTLSYGITSVEIGSGTVASNNLENQRYAAYWQFTPKEFINVWVNAQRVDSLSENGDPAAALDSPRAVRRLEMKHQSALVQLRRSSETTLYRAKYRIVERDQQDDSSTTGYWGQTLDADSRSLLSKGLTLGLIGRGEMGEYTGGEGDPVPIRTMTAATDVQYIPSPDLQTMSRYQFSGDRGADTIQHSVSSTANHRVDENMGITATVQADHTDYGAGRIESYRASQRATAGPWVTGPVLGMEGFASEALTLGAIEVAPGSSGALVGHAGRGTLLWLPARDHSVSGELLVANQTDWSSAGRTVGTYRASSGWLGRFWEKLSASSRLSYAISHSSGGRDGDNDFSQETGVESSLNGSITRSLVGHVGARYLLVQSQRDDNLTHSYSLYGGAGWVPTRTLSFSNSTMWTETVSRRSNRTLLTSESTADYSVRLLRFGVTYRFSHGDDAGIDVNRHLLLATLRRDFGADF